VKIKCLSHADGQNTPYLRCPLLTFLLPTYPALSWRFLLSQTYSVRTSRLHCGKSDGERSLRSHHVGRGRGHGHGHQSVRLSGGARAAPGLCQFHSTPTTSPSAVLRRASSVVHQVCSRNSSNLGCLRASTVIFFYRNKTLILTPTAPRTSVPSVSTSPSLASPANPRVSWPPVCSTPSRGSEEVCTR